ncbi:meiotic recombination protein REC114-like [Hydractinia symbiolongicarpus]|uniref:meiotic recombination protein REC114-like n=1 Tax=Hydractinia symbiolongicarpus TaxID=13093 RepID=UPI002550570C|nr:meiotic recombination protein REC114-like [Hydractinia symbiolongicarpus]
MAGKLWNVEKYARFKKDPPKDFIASSQIGGWQQFTSSASKPITIGIKSPLNVILQAGSEVLESFTLLQSSKWLKAIARKDNMLFFYRLQNSVRRFRIKFNKTYDKSSKESCEEFVRAISSHVHVQVVDNNGELSQTVYSQSSASESVLSNNKERKDEGRLSVVEITKSVLSGDISNLPSYYQHSNLEIDESEPDLIKTCLLDPNFPGFVEEVERRLKEMVAE